MILRIGSFILLPQLSICPGRPKSSFWSLLFGSMARQEGHVRGFRTKNVKGRRGKRTRGRTVSRLDLVALCQYLWLTTSLHPGPMSRGSCVMTTLYDCMLRGMDAVMLTVVQARWGQDTRAGGGHWHWGPWWSTTTPPSDNSPGKGMMADELTCENGPGARPESCTRARLMTSGRPST